MDIDDDSKTALCFSLYSAANTVAPYMQYIPIITEATRICDIHALYALSNSTYEKKVTGDVLCSADKCWAKGGANQVEFFYAVQFSPADEDAEPGRLVHPGLLVSLLL